jgi:type IV secretory pathway VirB2 component (pilin)
MGDKPHRNWRAIIVTGILIAFGAVRLFEMWVQGGARLH